MEMRGFRRALRYARKADAHQPELEPQMDAETKAIVEMTRTSDGREGIAAFLEKRRPDFKGA